MGPVDSTQDPQKNAKRTKLSVFSNIQIQTYWTFSLDLDENYKLFYYSIYFYYYSWVLLHFFSAIHRLHCTISTNFYLYLQYFQL